MWRGGRATSARRTGRSSSASRADGSVGQRQRGPVRPARFVARYGSRPNKFGRSGDETLLAGKGATGAAKFTPRGTTYVFVNVVVAPRYVARVQPGSGGLKAPRARVRRRSQGRVQRSPPRSPHRFEAALLALCWRCTGCSSTLSLPHERRSLLDRPSGARGLHFTSSRCSLMAVHSTRRSKHSVSPWRPEMDAYVLLRFTPFPPPPAKKSRAIQLRWIISVGALHTISGGATSYISVSIRSAPGGDM